MGRAMVLLSSGEGPRRSRNATVINSLAADLTVVISLTVVIGTALAYHLDSGRNHYRSRRR